MTKKATRAQLIEWALAMHRHGQMQSQTDRDAYVAALLAVLDLVINNVVDLSPPPPKQDAFITPIPARPACTNASSMAARKAERRLVAPPKSPGT